MSDTKKEWLTEKEVEQRYSIGVHWLRRKRYEGGGPPFVKVGALVRYPVESFEEWKNKHSFVSTSDVSAKQHRKGGMV